MEDMMDTVSEHIEESKDEDNLPNIMKSSNFAMKVVDEESKLVEDDLEQTHDLEQTQLLE